ncbi:hypothetical protein JAAARDRAFT_37967 [Jaapia argillacea MUCL 33604]|uniref:RIC1 C-terminal alpha solenoid region domain-containing protein n=1 Tax=Jaapia argillacea MUCL 33604 TaxID=933084 RepID=A0A067PWZ7_9AGAM|nr:hypothetical protein JAAARDRAFT_37967 [Jaapia argillacea MUCL 33604]
MYFPTSAARQLCTVPALPNLPHELVISLCPSPRRSLFCALTKSGLTIWRVRPSAILAHLARTPTSLVEHGESSEAHWSPDGKRIVIQTSKSFLILVTVEYKQDAVVYKSPPLAPGAQPHFLYGPGEALPFQGIGLHLDGVVRIDGQLLSVSPRKHYILFSTRNPPSIQRVPYPRIQEGDSSFGRQGERAYQGPSSWVLEDQDLPWMVDNDVSILKILHSRQLGVEIWITSDGRAYFVQLQENINSEGIAPELGVADDEMNENTEIPNSRTTVNRMDRKGGSTDDTTFARQFQWHGSCIHSFDVPRWVQKQRRVDQDDNSPYQHPYDEPRRAVAVAVNTVFSLIAIGTHGGSVALANFPSQDGAIPKSQVLQIPDSYNRSPSGGVCAMEWSSDGYVLAVGWEHGWAVWSVGGRCLAWGFGVEDQVDEDKFQDTFMYGLRSLFWAPGNFELVVLAQRTLKNDDGQMFVVPFARSATTGQHAPDNTRYAFLQMDDRVLVYRGADQPDMSVINPESDVWQHIMIPQVYLAMNWPLRYSSISTDGRLIAVAGRRGLVHYSTTSGRWKSFADEVQEQAFSVRGGLLWFHHVLIASVEVGKSYQIRLYSRDQELSNKNVLHREILSSPVVILSLVDNSLLVYTADNTLSHFLIMPTATTIKLHLCGSITFDGIIAAPSAVRVLSWLIPSAQKQLGDPVDDLAVATVLMMVGGKLVLLRPRKLANQEVRYDMQILADRIEFCWIHLRGIGALENSLWGYDGQGIRVWLNALTIEAPKPSNINDVPETVKETVYIPLEFYPLSVLMDKGIIIGAEHETATRTNLPFVLFRHATSSHLFLDHVLRSRLETGQVQEAVVFATHYQNLVYFAHALEILLHTVVESEPTQSSSNGDDEPLAIGDGTLSSVIEFLDYFDEALDVVVRCARKTEMTRWRRLFGVVGNPKSLFETCIATKRFKTAASYLLVLHTLEQLGESNDDAIRLLTCAIDSKDWQLCRDLLRFLHSIDETGAALRNAVEVTGIVEVSNGEVVSSVNGTVEG